MSESELLNSIAKMLDEHMKSINERLDSQEAILDKVQANQETVIMPRLDSQEAKLDKVQVNQEAVIMPRVELLYEGHTAILEKVQRDPRFETLQDEVETLKMAVKHHTSELNDLKKAQ